jgi:hypothetical protein
VPGSEKPRAEVVARVEREATEGSNWTWRQAPAHDGSGRAGNARTRRSNGIEEQQILRCAQVLPKPTDPFPD